MSQQCVKLRYDALVVHLQWLALVSGWSARLAGWQGRPEQTHGCLRYGTHEYLPNGLSGSKNQAVGTDRDRAGKTIHGCGNVLSTPK